MNNLARSRTKAAAAISTHYVLPAMLSVNTLALFAFERLGGIPDWVKTAAALFLAF